jgi:Na+:H+ antiporter, NhaA family
MTKKQPKNSAKLLPKRPIDRIIVPVKSFLHIEAFSGGLLLFCTAFSLFIANSPWAGYAAAFWKTDVSLAIGSFSLKGDLVHLIINDALMTVFFFVVGLEIKREIVSGELNDPRKAMLPVFGAIGGVALPATIYLILQWGESGQRGWAIPMATDIAFVVGILALFGRRVPFGLKVFLLTLAIVDDLIAVLVIAFVFTDSISLVYVLAAAIGCGLTFLLNKLGVRSVMVYVLIGIGIWLSFFNAGIHSTIAGVILGLMTPTRAWIEKENFADLLENYWIRFSDGVKETDPLPTEIETLEFVARETLSPLHRLEMGLHPWVAFLIMPVFALANAGVPIQLDVLQNPITLAVALALLVGKPLGVIMACTLAIKLGLTRLPDGVRWSIFIAGSFLCGIGFTMSLFLTSLTFVGEANSTMASAGKVGTLLGSVASAVVGCTLLFLRFRSGNSSKKSGVSA